MVVYVFLFPMNQINDVVMNQDNSIKINIYTSESESNRTFSVRVRFD
jgi:hypothetical protein